MPVTSFVVLQLAIGLLFLVSGISKLQDPRAFTSALAEYRAVPKNGAPFAGGLLIFVELGISFSHLTGWYLRLASTTALLMLGLFAFVVAKAIWQRRTLKCLCFGSTSELVSTATLSRLAMLFGAELILLISLSTHSNDLSRLTAHELLGALVCASVVLSLIGWIFLVLQILIFAKRQLQHATRA